jgi:hypothetical protein
LVANAAPVLLIGAACALEPRYALEERDDESEETVRVERRKAITDDSLTSADPPDATAPAGEEQTPTPVEPARTDAGSDTPDAAVLDPSDPVDTPSLDHCTDSTLGPGETGVDCGSECASCADGEPCVIDADCQSRHCLNTCQSPECDDGRENGDETDVDCGGPCAPCPVGQRCRAHLDCESNRCLVVAELCVERSCPNGVHDGNESDIDCGGREDCPRCLDGNLCLENADCESGYCSPMTLLCSPQQCTSSADPCPALEECDEDAGCSGLSCSGGQCDAASCADGHNGLETGVDCGGASACPRCPVGQACVVDADCASNLCVSLSCAPQAESCIDARVSGAETGIDCGGPDCAACPPGRPCMSNSDCRSAHCTNGACALGAVGAACSSGTDCQWGNCVDSVCGLSTGTGACGNGADCGSGVCEQGQCVRSGASETCAVHTDCLSLACSLGSCALGVVGAQCGVDGDCLNDTCRVGQCLTAPVGGPCSANAECVTELCAAGACALGAADSPCRNDSDCASATCAAGSCSAG